MLVREISDLHTEFWSFNKFERMLDRIVPRLDTDKETVLVLAGDLGTFAHYASTLKPLLNLLAKRFLHVLITYGNHEWYHSRVWGNEETYWKDKKLPANVHILTDDYKIIDDVVFIGATLWTDFNNADPIAMFHCRGGMNDYECIRMEGDAGPYTSIGTKLTPEHTLAAHYKSRKFIFNALHILRDTVRKSVVFTHHLPTEMSVPKRFKGDLLNHAFFSNIDEDIAFTGPDIWFHGHTHDSVDYKLGETRIICNPFGYHASQVNKEYNPILTLEL